MNVCDEDGLFRAFRQHLDELEGLLNAFRGDLRAHVVLDDFLKVLLILGDPSGDLLEVVRIRMSPGLDFIAQVLKR